MAYETLFLRLPVETKERLKKITERTGETMTEVIVRLINKED